MIAKIEIEVRAMPVGVEMHGASRHGGNDQQFLQACSRIWGGGRTRPRKLKIKEALKLIVDEEAAKMINEEELKCARSRMPSKTASCSSTKSTRSRAGQETMGADVSRRRRAGADLLPLGGGLHG